MEKKTTRQPLATSSSQLQDHMNDRPRSNVALLERLVVRELLSREDELDLVDLDAFLFLERLLDGEDLILGLEVEGLFAAGQCFDKDLETWL